MYPVILIISAVTHHLQDALRMAYPPHFWEWMHPFQAFLHNKPLLAAGLYLFSVMGWVSHSQCVLQLMMTCYIKTLEMGVSILSNGVGKPFSVPPASDYDSYNSCFSSYALESATLFLLVLLLGTFSYQLPISSSFLSIAIVSATPLSYCYQYTMLAIK